MLFKVSDTVKPIGMELLGFYIFKNIYIYIECDIFVDSSSRTTDLDKLFPCIPIALGFEIAVY